MKAKKAHQGKNLLKRNLQKRGKRLLLKVINNLPRLQKVNLVKQKTLRALKLMSNRIHKRDQFKRVSNLMKVPKREVKQDQKLDPNYRLMSQ